MIGVGVHGNLIFPCISKLSTMNVYYYFFKMGVKYFTCEN